jgi:hypothetical protein
MSQVKIISDCSKIFLIMRQKKVKDHHFAFVELESSTAESIFNGILGLF